LGSRSVIAVFGRGCPLVGHGGRHLVVCVVVDKGVMRSVVIVE